MRIRVRARNWIGLGIVALCAVAVGLLGRDDTKAAWAVVDIDGYPIRTTVTSCADPLVGKPGVADFRGMILSQVGGGDDGMAVCKRIADGSGVYSDHADGRAWDWRVKASRATDRAMVDRVLNWLLRTDERGRRNAMARRLGITYIIWNHQYYRVGSNNARWVPYTGTSDPHDTHVHFSFSVPGAARQTSWWSQRGPLKWLLQKQPEMPFTFGEGYLLPLAGDWDGDGRDTVGSYNTTNRTFSLRNAVTSGHSAVITPPVGPFGAIPFAGNWDGVGGDEIGVYEPLARAFRFYTLTGSQARPTQVFGASGDLPIIGDWNGDGTDDIGTYTAGSRTFCLLLPDGTVRTEVFGRANDTPVVGDWNGDGIDDIGAFRSSDDTFLLPVGAGNLGSQAIKSIKYRSSPRFPVIGDWDGNGTDNQGIAVATESPSRHQR